jgi:hypothetical protein
MLTILIRKVSPYMSANILLGVFTSPEEADRNRNAYLASRTQAQTSDPWHHQPYKPDGLQPSDLFLMDFRYIDVVADSPAFVVSKYSEGFGQVLRKFISIHADLATAKSEAARLEEADNDPFPSYFRVQEAIVGQLLSDAPEAQPRIYD